MTDIWHNILLILQLTWLTAYKLHILFVNIEYGKLTNQPLYFPGQKPLSQSRHGRQRALQLPPLGRLNLYKTTWTCCSTRGLHEPRADFKRKE